MNNLKIHWYAFRLWVYSFFCDHDWEKHKGWKGQPAYKACVKCGNYKELE